MEKIKLQHTSFFREAAVKDSHEFFAIALENFFERSSGFQKYNPELYRSLVFLLKQDPLVLAG
jgi:Mlc titration factor MtfA (ptsG expression regulator)